MKAMIENSSLGLRSCTFSPSQSCKQVLWMNILLNLNEVFALCLRELGGLCR
jgi:hypothetical protein